jgi:hypothetical protein
MLLRLNWRPSRVSSKSPAGSPIFTMLLVNYLKLLGKNLENLNFQTILIISAFYSIIKSFM